jgi:hypothetical protein
MINQEFILLIMNCKKYAKKALFQKRTWLRFLPDSLKYYHVIGDETLETQYKFDDDKQILWVKTPDDYNSLPKKVITAYDAVYNTFDFKYLFKTDDDQILVQPHFYNVLINLLNTRMPAIHYGGFIVDVKRPHISEYYKVHPELPRNLLLNPTKYCTGRFYFLSKSAASHLINKRDRIMSEYFEDYAIGFYLDQVFKTNMLSLATNKIFTDIELSDYPLLVKQGRI